MDPPSRRGPRGSSTAVMARAIGAIVLHEAAAEIDNRRSEMAAVACGFGVLLVNGAAIWGKACGGLRMTRATALTVEELAVALALFGGLHGIRPSTTRRHLETTQRAAFDVAHDWVESNPMLLEELRDRPQILEGGVFDVEPVRGVIGRWFHKRRLEREMRAVATAPPPIAMTDDKQRRLREARALVDEVMGAVDSEESRSLGRDVDSDPGTFFVVHHRASCAGRPARGQEWVEPGSLQSSEAARLIVDEPVLRHDGEHFGAHDAGQPSRQSRLDEQASEKTDSKFVVARSSPRVVAERIEDHATTPHLHGLFVVWMVANDRVHSEVEEHPRVFALTRSDSGVVLPPMNAHNQHVDLGPQASYVLGQVLPRELGAPRTVFGCE